MSATAAKHLGRRRFVLAPMAQRRRRSHAVALIGLRVAGSVCVAFIILSFVGSVEISEVRLTGDFLAFLIWMHAEATRRG